MPRLFVYGTLKRGFSNAAELAGAIFEESATTAPGFELYAVSGYPALVRSKAGAVRGEVYAVSVEHLGRLDAFEDVPNWYRRETISLEDGSEVQAYLMSSDRVQGFARIDAEEFREEGGPTN